MENTRKWWHTVAIPFGLSLITGMVYWTSLRFGYIFDDQARIVQNFSLRSFSPIKGFLTDGRWISTALNSLTYQYYALQPFGYRLGNLIMHIMIGLLIFFLLHRVLKRQNNRFFVDRADMIAGLTAGLFLLHPLQTQTATYITQMRLEGLAMLFICAVLFAFSSAIFAKRKGVSWGWYGVAGLLAMLSAGTKEIIIVLPALLLLFDWFFLAQGSFLQLRSRLVIHAVLACALFIPFSWYKRQISLVDAITLSKSVENNRGNQLTEKLSDSITPRQFLISQFRVIVHYIKVFVWPFNLSFDYDMRLVSDFWSMAVVPPLLFLLLLLAMASWFFWSDPTHMVSFVLGWFFVTVLPRASIIPSPELVCDYKTYIASFGVFLGMSIGIIKILEWLFEKMRRMSMPTLQPYAKAVSIMVLLLGCSYASYTRSLVWRSASVFWADVISKAPYKVRAYNNYGVGLADEGKFEEAVNQFQAALACDPTYGEAHANLALHYQGSGNHEKAGEHFREAVKTAKTAHPEFFQGLGVYNMKSKDYERAEKCFNLALSLRPPYSKAHTNLGRIHAIRKDFQKAKECFEQALHGDVPSIEALYLHGEACYNLEQWDNAIKSFNTVIQRTSSYKKAESLLGLCYFKIGSYNKARDCFASVCAKEPANKVITYNYAQALLRCQEYEKALAYFEQSQDINNPLNEFTPLYKAQCYWQLGNKVAAQNEVRSCMKSASNDDVKKQAKELLTTFAKAA